MTTDYQSLVLNNSVSKMELLAESLPASRKSIQSDEFQDVY